MNIQELMNQAFAHHQQGQYDQAQNLYQRVLQKDPSFADAYYLLGILASQKKDYHKTQSLIQQAIDLKPEEPTYHFNLARTYQKLDLEGLAQESFKRALELRPHDIQAQYQLGLMLKQQNRLEEALKCFNQVVSVNQWHTEALFHSGETHNQLGQNQEAITLYQQILTILPNHFQSHRNLGLTYHQNAQFELSLKHYKQALELAPNPNVCVGIYNNLGNLFQENHRYSDAVPYYFKALEINSNFVEAYHNLGHAYDKLQEVDQALHYYEKAIELKPSPETFCNVGVLWFERDEIEKALLAYQEALRIDLNHIPAYNYLGQLFLAQEDSERAFICYEKALHQDSDINLVPLLGLGRTKAIKGEIDEALSYYQRALELKPDSKLIKLSLASVYREKGQLEEALNIYDEELTNNQQWIKAIAGKAGVYERQRKFEEAYQLIKPFIDKGIVNSQLASTFGTVCRRLKRHPEGILYIQQTLKEREPSFRERRNLLFRLGELYDDIKQADQAFPYFLEANLLRPQTFNPQNHKQRIEQLQKTFTTEFFTQVKKPTHQSRRPVFIVGMPRSGTTLTEQIICSHPDVFGAGELKQIGKIAQLIRQKWNPKEQSFQKYLLSLSTEQLNAYAQIYLDYLNSLNSCAQRVTDKMPLNFLHVGFIRLLFPDAPIIHCQRHPLDTCLSCFTKDFRGHDYSNNLEHLGQFYLEYQQIMSHWRKVIGTDYLEINYEETVANQEAQSRHLIAHCDLEWHAQCLQFYQSQRFVHTASYEQVKRPMYQSSVARFKPYKKHLKPLIDILDIQV